MKIIALTVFLTVFTLSVTAKNKNGQFQYLYKTQQIYNQEAQRLANQKALEQGQVIANTLSREHRLNSTLKTLAETQLLYESIYKDSQSSQSEKMKALEKITQYKLLQSTLDINNIDDYANLHSSIVGN